MILFSTTQLPNLLFKELKMEMGFLRAFLNSKWLKNQSWLNSTGNEWLAVILDIEWPKITTTTNSSLQRQAVWVQRSNACFSPHKGSFFTTSQTAHISRNYFLTVFSHCIRERPAFRLALDDSCTRTTFGNPSFFICRTCPSHLNLPLFIAQECGTEPHFSYSLLLGGDLKLDI